MKPVWIGIAAALVLAAGCGPRNASFRQHPDMIDTLKAKGRVTLLPAEVAVFEMDLYGDNQRLVDLEKRLKSEVEQSIAKRFEMRGFELRSARLSDEELDGDADVRFDLTRLEVGYSHLTFRAYRKSLDDNQARLVKLGMGPLVNRFADRADADVLVFTTLAGFVKSEGRRQKDGFFTVIGALLGTYRPSPVAAAVFEIGLVDGTSGELLWVDRTVGVFYEEIDSGFLIDNSLDRFHGLHDSPPAAAPDPPPAAGEAAEPAL